MTKPQKWRANSLNRGAQVVFALHRQRVLMVFSFSLVCLWWSLDGLLIRWRIFNFSAAYHFTSFGFHLLAVITSLTLVLVSLLYFFKKGTFVGKGGGTGVNLLGFPGGGSFNDDWQVSLVSFFSLEFLKIQVASQPTSWIPVLFVRNFDHIYEAQNKTIHPLGRNGKSLSRQEKFNGEPTNLLEVPLEEGPPEFRSGGRPVPHIVDQIRKDLVNEGWDRRIIEIYCDEIRLFPRWLDSGSPRLPKQISAITSVQSHSGERIWFDLGGKRFSWELQRPSVDRIGETVLEVQIDAKSMVRLIVKEEIGTMDCLQIQRFIRGEWMESFRSLERLLKRSFQPALREDSVVVPAEEDVETLKENFGLRK